MKIFNATLLTTALVLASQTALAQEDIHSDVELVYENGMIAIEFGDEGNVFEGEFPTSGASERRIDDPGFATHLDEGGGVNPGDTIDYLILAPLTYHNGTDFAPVPAGASIVIEDAPSGDLIVDANTVGPVSGPGAITAADALGEFDSHLDFILNPLSLDSAEYGAYGLLMQLTTDAPGIAPSEPFFIVFNFGLDEEIYEGAVGAFAQQVPEPSAALLLVLASTALVGKRR